MKISWLFNALPKSYTFSVTQGLDLELGLELDNDARFSLNNIPVKYILKHLDVDSRIELIMQISKSMRASLGGNVELNSWKFDKGKVYLQFELKF